MAMRTNLISNRDCVIALVPDMIPIDICIRSFKARNLRPKVGILWSDMGKANVEQTFGVLRIAGILCMLEDQPIQELLVGKNVRRRHLVDPEEACEVLSTSFKPHDLLCADQNNRFEFVHVSAEVPVGSFNVLQYGAEVQITPEPFEDFFMLEMPMKGGANLESEGRPTAQSSPERALFVPPHARFQSEWAPNTVQLMLQIRKDVVLERWQMLCQDPTRQLPKMFPEIELATTEGWRIRKLLLLLSEEMKEAVALGADSLADTPLAAATVDATLAYFRKHQATMADNPESVLPRHLRNCVRYIHDNLAGDLSVPVLLRHSDVSERSLFKLFKTFLHQSPRAYVEAVRLRQARKLLLGGDTVSGAARASGFTHMGRFSATYEKSYGEKPSETRTVAYPKSAKSSKI